MRRLEQVDGVPTIIDIEPVSLIGIVGAELFKARVHEIVIRCETRRAFNHAMENEILPAIRALFDDRVAHDALRLAREIYRMRGEHAQVKEGPQEERPALAPAQIGEARGIDGNPLPAGPGAAHLSRDAASRQGVLHLWC